MKKLGFASKLSLYGYNILLVEVTSVECIKAIIVAENDDDYMLRRLITIIYYFTTNTSQRSFVGGQLQYDKGAQDEIHVGCNPLVCWGIYEFKNYTSLIQAAYN